MCAANGSTWSQVRALDVMFFAQKDGELSDIFKELLVPSGKLT